MSLNNLIVRLLALLLGAYLFGRDIALKLIFEYGFNEIVAVIASYIIGILIVGVLLLLVDLIFKMEV